MSNAGRRVFIPSMSADPPKREPNTTVGPESAYDGLSFRGVTVREMRRLAKADLVEIKIEVDKTLGDIWEQMKKLRGNSRVSMPLENYHEYGRARAALRLRQRLSQWLQAEIGRRGKETRFEYCFRKAAKEMLDLDLYLRIMDRAKELRQSSPMVRIARKVVGPNNTSGQED